MAYREQPFVERSAERCFCEVVAATTCRCCGRPRCQAHVRDGLCDRCDQAVARERPRAATTGWIAGCVLAVVVTAGLLPIIGPIGLLVRLPAAGLGGVAANAIAIRRRVRALGPVLSQTVGELPPAAAEEPFPAPGGSGADISH
jgi:hypothetical protein